MKHAEIKIGQKFGLLTVLSELQQRHRCGHIQYLCKCECGNKKVVTSGNLAKKGQPTRSCGCLRIKTAQNRGLSNKSFTKEEYRMRRNKKELPLNRIRSQKAVSECSDYYIRKYILGFDTVPAEFKDQIETLVTLTRIRLLNKRVIQQKLKRS